MNTVDIQRLVAAIGRLTIAEVHADKGIQPVNCRAGTLRKLAGDFRIVVAFAAETTEISIEQVDAVFDARFFFDDGFSTDDRAAGNRRRTADARHLLKNQHIGRRAGWRGQRKKDPPYLRR